MSYLHQDIVHRLPYISNGAFHMYVLNWMYLIPDKEKIR